MRTTFALASLLIVGFWRSAIGDVQPEAPVAEINNDHGIALRGFDPVAYFTDAQAVPGERTIQYAWKGATYRFATKEHLRLFATDPTHYAPQFGGYCALAVSMGTTADGDPLQWTVDGDRLFLNNNPKALKIWNEDRARNIRKGTENWPLIAKRPLPRSQSSGVADRDSAGGKQP
jgi:YHS domain-containing protein